MFILKIQRPWKSNVTLFTLFSYNFGVLSEKITLLPDLVSVNIFSVFIYYELSC